MANRMSQAMASAAEYRRVVGSEGPNTERARGIRRDIEELVGQRGDDLVFRIPRPVMEAMGLPWDEIQAADAE